MGWRAVVVTAALWTGVSGCNPIPRTVAARPLAPIAIGEIRRIAIMPFTSAGLAPSEPEPGADPLPERPEETVERAVRQSMQRHRDWQIVDELTVREALRQLYGEPRPPTPDEARAAGRLLKVDAVLRGQVEVFEERIGTDLAAKRPARVVFGVELLRLPSGEPAWQAEYAEQQQSLSENLWNLPGFVRAGGTWVRAGELAGLGADQVVDRLHDTLYGPPPRKGSKSRPKR